MGRRDLKTVFRNSDDARLIKSQGARRRPVLKVEFDPLVSTSEHVKSRKEVPSEASKTIEEPAKPLQFDSIDDRFTFPSQLMTTSRVVDEDAPVPKKINAYDRYKDQWNRQVNLIFKSRQAANFKRRYKSPDRETTLMDL